LWPGKNANAVTVASVMAVTPIFLVSLPRSGSTFTQRVIAAHPGIATRSEPWIMLPLLDILRRPMPMQSTYHASVAIGVEDFVGELPGGEEEYLREIGDLGRRLYSRVAGDDAEFFLDKTVQYFMVTEQLMAAFPDAKFIFLWRNPLSVISSVTETLGQGRWIMAKHRFELFHGIHDMVAAYERHSDRVHAVRYEDLISGEDAWRGVMDHIGVPFDPSSLSGFTQVDLTGRRGDKVGSRKYDALSTEPLQKWRETLGNPLRIAWCRRYLMWVGAERLAVMGYDLDTLLAQLDEIETRPDGVLRDGLDLVYAAGREIWRARQPENRLVSSFRTLVATPER
jgi:hypothetical protein